LERLTVNTALIVPLFPSIIVTSLMEIVALSSLLIVPCPWLSAKVTLRPLGFRLLRLTKRFSLPSTLVSPLIGTVIVLEISPGLKVKAVRGRAV
jgi:hypothetical protein